jgi:acetyl-CoA C-acetyltransferase
MQALDLDPDQGERVTAAPSRSAIPSARPRDGARTVLDELERTGKGTALVTLCVAAGMGTATIIERV